MRLYPLTETAHVNDAQWGRFVPQPDGGFDFPEPLSGKLAAAHVRGVKQWETAAERQQRLIREELARRQSPEALYDAVATLVAKADAITADPPAEAAEAPGPAKAPAKAAPARADGK